MVYEINNIVGMNKMRLCLYISKASYTFRTSYY